MGMKIQLMLECDTEGCQTRHVELVDGERVQRAKRKLETELGWRRRLRTWICPHCVKKELTPVQFFEILNQKLEESKLEYSIDVKTAAELRPTTVFMPEGGMGYNFGHLWRKYDKTKDLSVIDEEIEIFMEWNKVEEKIDDIFLPFVEMNDLDLSHKIRHSRYGHSASIGLKSKLVVFCPKKILELCEKIWHSTSPEIVELFIKAATIHETGHYYRSPYDRKLENVMNDVLNERIGFEEYKKKYAEYLYLSEVDAWNNGWKEYKRPWSINEERYEEIKKFCLDGYHKNGEKIAESDYKKMKKQSA